MTEVPVLLLADGHNLPWRAAFGTPAVIHSRVRHNPADLTAQFMFFALLRKAINTDLPAWPEIVVVFDGQHGNADRQDVDAGYKAQRPQIADALTPILALPDVKMAWTCTRSRGSRSMTPKPTISSPRSSPRTPPATS